MLPDIACISSHFVNETFSVSGLWSIIIMCINYVNNTRGTQVGFFFLFSRLVKIMSQGSYIKGLQP